MKKGYITSQLILENTIDYVANHGLENVTTKKVANEMNISEGTILYHYKNKKTLLRECLYYVDNKIDGALKEVSFWGFNLPKGIKELWFKYFEYLIAHGNYTKFYLSYRQSSYYDEETMKGQNKSFAFFIKIVKKVMPKLGADPDIFWVYLIETTLNFAVRVSDKQIENNDKNIEKIFKIIFYGINGITHNHKMEEFK
ncbi:TetR/AcrR family transcriptional regulator [Anaerofustis stercorihominis]|uniref:TetR/AcrR family transcriptional regulator n=1 Tax=Anaerofustis stercorihominis TaxID=214853 RepID=UPI00214BB94C|nr:TetR/AcrR family transcriptional regulator [Anaerofustis stercorihominis]MCR2032656.1 TetR/AcrR family transcriptional regulator [Anaerofustis stercorihominis]